MAHVLPRDAVGLIGKLFPHADDTGRSFGRQVADRLMAVLDVVDKVPPELITLDSEGYSAFVANCAAIRWKLAAWTAGTEAGELAPISGFERNPLVVVRDILATCPNEIVSPGTTELPLLKSDPDLQKALRLDISRAERALVNDEWKAGTVLAGSVLEAVLLWALSRHGAAAAAAPSASKRPLEDWHLREYIEVAIEIGVLFTADTITEARLCGNFRNLIHPGRAQRLNQPCDRGTTRVALAAVEHVVRDLTAKCP